MRSMTVFRSLKDLKTLGSALPALPAGFCPGLFFLLATAFTSQGYQRRPSKQSRGEETAPAARRKPMGASGWKSNFFTARRGIPVRHGSPIAAVGVVLQLQLLTDLGASKCPGPSHGSRSPMIFGEPNET